MSDRGDSDGDRADMPLADGDRADGDRADMPEGLELSGSARAGHSSGSRWLWRAVWALVVLFVAYEVSVFVDVRAASSRDEAQPAQAIVVLGAAQYNGVPSPVLRARLDHALALRRQGVSSTIVVTGGSLPGDAHSEASASADYLIAKGVPDSDILREVDGKDTWEELAAADLFLRRLGIRQVVLVSDPFHAARLGEIAEEIGLDAYVSPATDSPIEGAEEFAYLVRETLAVSVGRLLGYERMHRVRS